jgi:hypothetical protein
VASGVMASVDRRVQLTTRDMALLVECWLELLVATVAIRRRPGMLRSLVQEPPAEGTRASEVELRQLLKWVDRAASLHFKHMTCLERAVALQRVLTRRGVAARLEIGARKCESEWETHAWVSVNGLSLDAQQLHFQVLRSASVVI